MTGAMSPKGRPKLSGLARTSLREQALHSLRNALTSGDIAQGTHLVETELSEALNISRGTLREALRQLQQEGLVEAGERGRAIVTDHMQGAADNVTATPFDIRHRIA